MKHTTKYLMLFIACLVATNMSATYYIAGNGDVSHGSWCGGNDWSVNATALVNDEITFTALPAEWYAFKITDGSWGSGHEWGYTDVDASLSSPMYKDGGGNNIGFRLQAAADGWLVKIGGRTMQMQRWMLIIHVHTTICLSARTSSR